MESYKYATVIRDHIVKLNEYQIRIVPGKKEADRGIAFLDEDDDVDIDASPVEYDQLEYIDLGEWMPREEIRDELESRDIHPDDYQTVPDQGGDDL